MRVELDSRPRWCGVRPPASTSGLATRVIRYARNAPATLATRDPSQKERFSGPGATPLQVAVFSYKSGTACLKWAIACILAGFTELT